ncbi:hypothetical protein SLEP1_g51679 [Rubroshorea leprosula]|uniref:Pentatricopeptide repeat-containing protein n=1 Tax=Rubroshorea leprosula TaxID=152421 RepID=A0AAV5M4Q8_9ROSI|nr:hypothetical protein SLEP1_g51679 [Rubroshorea leprosula]
MPSRNLTSWDTMITWLPQNGLGEDALDLFIQFKKAGLKRDGQMFIGVFSACSILGDINEGMLHFESMSNDYGIIHPLSTMEVWLKCWVWLLEPENDDGEEAGVPESYQLCRKKSTVERMKGSLVRVKRVMWSMLGSALGN